MLNIYSDLLPISFHNSKEKYRTTLEHNGLDSRFVDKLFNADFINDKKLAYSKLVRTCFSLNLRSVGNSDFDSMVVLKGKNDAGKEITDKPYKYDNNLKLMFILNYSKKLYLWQGLKSISNNFDNIERFEVEHNKSVLDFTKADMLSIVKYYREKYINYITYRKCIADISEFIDFCVENFEAIHIVYKRYWSYKEVINTIPQTKMMNRFFTLKDINDIVKNEDCLQNTIVPLLVFSGVRLSKVDSLNEMVKIKEEELAKDSIHINNSDMSREVKVTPQAMKYLQKSLKENYYTMKYDNKTIEIPHTGYLLRPFGYNKKINSSISEAAVQKRLRYFQHNYKEQIADRKFDYSTIRNSGKITNISTQMILGYNIDDAVYQTLIKFGDLDEKEILGKPTKRAQYSMYKLRQTFLKAKNKK